MWGGPRQEVPIRLVLRWDADGNDEVNLNDEWVRIHNDGDVPLGMDGWVLRDSAHVRFIFRRDAPRDDHPAARLHPLPRRRQLQTVGQPFMTV
jgi:hypothetical protein